MKGFYITVKNGLLDSKHIKAMGGNRNIGTIWLFLWLLDKMTIIDEEKGEGKVLGGRPIKFEQIHQDLGISDKTYRRWLQMLREGNYITTIKTSGGLIITVYKAYKVFGRRIHSSVLEDRTESTIGDRTQPPLETELNDKTVNKTDIELIDINSSKQGKTINEIIFLFKVVNPLIQRLYGSPPQRKSVQRMLKEFGKENLERMIKSLPAINSQKYYPKSTTPTQLENNIAYYIAKKSELESQQLSKDKVAVII